jgi:transcriptional regulator of acetoin/glycerol metabolism
MKLPRGESTELALPDRPSKVFRELATAWERFVASGELVGGAPRPVIARRWQQCRELAIDPLMDRAPTAITAEELEAILAREDLGQAGQQVLTEFGQAVEDTGHVILLADAQGRILYSAGHARLRRTLDRLNLAPGGDWAETIVGPNGVGTPIALGRPETVFGPEHYAYDWPGNVRELQNLCARWSLTIVGPDILVDDVPLDIREPARSGSGERSAGSLWETEDNLIRRTLEEAGGRVGEAARRLDVAKTTIYRRLKRWAAASEQVAE